MATLMIATMIQATKYDGTFDEYEPEKLLTYLGDVTAEETHFVHALMDTPIEIGPQIYAI